MWLPDAFCRSRVNRRHSLLLVCEFTSITSCIAMQRSRLSKSYQTINFTLEQKRSNITPHVNTSSPLPSTSPAGGAPSAEEGAWGDIIYDQTTPHSSRVSIFLTRHSQQHLKRACRPRGILLPERLPEVKVHMARSETKLADRNENTAQS